MTTPATTDGGGTCSYVTRKVRVGTAGRLHGGEAEAWEASELDEEGVRAAIGACRTLAVQGRLSAVRPAAIQVGHVVAEMNYYPTRFASRPAVYAREYAREPRLDLPLRSADFDGVCFADALG